MKSESGAASLADRYRQLRRARDPRLSNFHEKTVTPILPDEKSQPPSARRITLLKMTGVVLLCALYHYVGYFSGKKLSDETYRGELREARREAASIRADVGEAWKNSTLRRFEAQGMKIGGVIERTRQLEPGDAPVLPSREEYMEALNNLYSAKLLSAEEFVGYVNRASWHEWQTPEKAWATFCKSPEQNLLPFFWYARSDDRMLEYLLHTRLPLDGNDRSTICDFIFWYMPYMDDNERQTLVQSRLRVTFNPMALLRTDGKGAAAMLYFSTGLSFTNVSLTLDPARCTIQCGDFSLGRLITHDGTGFAQLDHMVYITPEAPVQIPADGEIHFVLNGTIRIQSPRGPDVLCWDVPFSLESDDIPVATFHPTPPTDSADGPIPHQFAYLKAELME